MAMGPAKGQAATLQVEMVCLDELVPVDDRLRRLDALVDWGFVRAEAAPYYAADVGRPSIDPIVLVKLMLVGALEGIDSMRELLRVASMRVDIRRFLGYGFTRAAAGASDDQSRADAAVRRRAGCLSGCSCASVALCKRARPDRRHAPVGRRLSRRGRRGAGQPARQPCAGRGRRRARGHAGRFRGSAARPSATATAALARERRSARSWRWPSRGRGRRPKRRSSNATSSSRTDPDAKLRGKPGQRPHLVHRAPDRRRSRRRAASWRAWARPPTAMRATRWRRSSQRARFACPRAWSRSAPTRGSPASRSGQDVAALGVIAYVPPQRTMLPPAGEEPKTDAKREALAARAAVQDRRTGSGRTSGACATPRAASPN